METEIDRMDSLNSNGLVNMEQLSELDEVDGLDLDEQQLAEATDEVIFLSWLLVLWTFAVLLLLEKDVTRGIRKI